MKDVIYRDSGEKNILSASGTLNASYNAVPPADHRMSGLVDLTASVVDQYIKSEALKTFSDFRSTYLLKTKEIYDRNSMDPVAYANEYDSFVNGVLKKLPDQSFKMKLLDFCGDDKQRGILAITRNKMVANTQSAIQSVREGSEYSISQLPITFAAGYSDAEEKNINDSLLANFQRAISGYNARLDGKLLISPNETLAFIEQYNRAVGRNVMESVLSNCDNIESTNLLLARLSKGEIKIPVFGIQESDGDMVGTIIGNRPISLDDDEIREIISRHRGNLIIEVTKQKQLSELVTEDCMHFGVTQQAADQYFNEFSDIFKTGELGDQISCAKGIAQRMDMLPGVVKNMIERTVSGDAATYQLANVFLTAWKKENPRALADAFRDNPGTLARAMYLVDNGIEPTRINNEYETEYYDRIASTQLANDKIDVILNEAFGYDARRVVNADGQPQLWHTNWGMDDVAFDYDDAGGRFSELFYQEVRDKYCELLKNTNGDINSANQALRVMLSRYRHSDFMGGVSMYAPENYSIVRKYKALVKEALNQRAQEYLKYALANSELDKDVQYLRSELIANDVTARDDCELQSARKNGREYFELSNGLKIYSPTYVHMIHYLDGGIERSLIIGEFNPSIIGVAQ